MGKPLPDDSVFEILLLLPVKSIRRFESVSKSCFSAIHSRFFINRHFQHVIKTNSSPTLISLSSPRLDRRRPTPPNASLFICFSDMDAPGNLRKLECETNNQVLSCNGLLCFSLCSNRYIVISNLVSNPKDYHMIPIPSVKKYPKGVSSRPPFFGFGFDSVNDDYKVLVMDDRRSGLSYAETRVYSLRSNTWSKSKGWDAIGQRKTFPIIVNIHYRNMDSSRNGIVASGAFHWLAAERLNTLPLFILAFSFTSEEFYDMPLPGFTSEVSTVNIRLGVLKRRLCISTCDSIPNLRSVVDIWVMKDYNVYASWTKIIHMEDTHYGMPSCLLPIYSRSEYEILFLDEYGQRFYRYDPRNNKLVGCVGDPLQQRELHRHIGFRTTTTCLETLVSLNDFKVLWEGDSKRKRKRKDDFALTGTKRRWTIKDEEQALECFFKIRDNFHLFWSKS